MIYMYRLILNEAKAEVSSKAKSLNFCWELSPSLHCEYEQQKLPLLLANAISTKISCACSLGNIEELIT